MYITVLDLIKKELLGKKMKVRTSSKSLYVTKYKKYFNNGVTNKHKNLLINDSDFKQSSLAEKLTTEVPQEIKLGSNSVFETGVVDCVYSSDEDDIIVVVRMENGKEHNVYMYLDTKISEIEKGVYMTEYYY